MEAFGPARRFQVIGESSDDAAGGRASEGGVANPVYDSMLANFCEPDKVHGEGKGGCVVEGYWSSRRGWEIEMWIITVRLVEQNVSLRMNKFGDFRGRL